MRVWNLERLRLVLGSVDLAQQAAEKPREHHLWTVVVASTRCPSLRVLERRHWVEHDAEVVLSRDLMRGLADAEQFAETESPRAREQFESGHRFTCPRPVARYRRPAGWRFSAVRPHASDRPGSHGSCAGRTAPSGRGPRVLDLRTPGRGRSVRAPAANTDLLE